jgi:hypothetical protein
MTQVLHPSLYQVNTESVIDWTQFSENLPRPSLPSGPEALWAGGQRGVIPPFGVFFLLRAGKGR